ncbi:MAG: hypothetical protein EXS59_02975 [Candidatus Taylorbacteria bacterium]|nr:hypothetical protein [Candidatus Taylorbacteria bacterium]
MSEKIYPSVVTVNGSNLARCGISAPDRKRAVQKMLLWFWEEYKGKYGPASEVLTVGDPYNEAVFTEDWNCNDKRNNYLDATTMERVIEESKGILECDSKNGSPHHPRRSTRRKNRRRKYPDTVAPNIHRSSTGRLYYRVIVVPQKSRRGVISVHRKMQDIKLEARTLAEAVEEIRKRGLKVVSEKNTARRGVKVRSIKFLSHIVGITLLEGDDLEYFSPVLKNRKMPKPGMGEGSTV